MPHEQGWLIAKIFNQLIDSLDVIGGAVEPKSTRAIPRTWRVKRQGKIIPRGKILNMTRILGVVFGVKSPGDNNSQFRGVFVPLANYCQLKTFSFDYSHSYIISKVNKKCLKI